VRQAVLPHINTPQPHGAPQEVQQVAAEHQRGNNGGAACVVEAGKLSEHRTSIL